MARLVTPGAATRRWPGAQFLLALVLSPPALAGALDDFLAFSASTKAATARFEQQVFDRGGRAVDRSRGSFAFARPGKFRWAYEAPNRSLIVGDGARLWIHDPDLNQVTVKRIDRAISATPAALLAGRDDITKLFALREAGESEGLAWVEALPREKDTGFESVRIGLKGGTLAAMELADSLGGRTRLAFTGLKASASLPADLFRFTPPAGADVIEEK
jgi:outer membrane lipoprotein carrier protein